MDGFSPLKLRTAVDWHKTRKPSLIISREFRGSHGRELERVPQRGSKPEDELRRKTPHNWSIRDSHLPIKPRAARAPL